MRDEFLLLLLRNAIATKERLIACANMETHHGDGWRCDWDGMAREVDHEIDHLVTELQGYATPGAGQ